MIFRNTTGFLGLLILLVIASCKEPDGIGLDVLPEGEEMTATCPESGEEYVLKGNTFTALKVAEVAAAGVSCS